MVGWGEKASKHRGIKLKLLCLYSCMCACIWTHCTWNMCTNKKKLRFIFSSCNRLTTHSFSIVISIREALVYPLIDVKNNEIHEEGLVGRTPSTHTPNDCSFFQPKHVLRITWVLNSFISVWSDGAITYALDASLCNYAKYVQIFCFVPKNNKKGEKE